MKRQVTPEMIARNNEMRQIVIINLLEQKDWYRDGKPEEFLQDLFERTLLQKKKLNWEALPKKLNILYGFDEEKALKIIERFRNTYAIRF